MDEVADEFMRRVTEAMNGLVVGDPFEAAADIGLLSATFEPPALEDREHALVEFNHVFGCCTLLVRSRQVTVKPKWVALPRVNCDETGDGRHEECDQDDQFWRVEFRGTLTSATFGGTRSISTAGQVISVRSQLPSHPSTHIFNWH
jgi:hypothetical protein